MHQTQPCELTTSFWGKIQIMLGDAHSRTQVKHYRIYLPARYLQQARELYAREKRDFLVDLLDVALLNALDPHNAWTIISCPVCEKCKYLHPVGFDPLNDPFARGFIAHAGVNEPNQLVLTGDHIKEAQEIRLNVSIADLLQGKY